MIVIMYLWMAIKFHIIFTFKVSHLNQTNLKFLSIPKINF